MCLFININKEMTNTYINTLQFLVKILIYKQNINICFIALLLII